MDCKSAGECVSRRDGGCAGPPSENLKDLARAHTFVNLIHIAGNVLLTGERRELEGKAVFFVCFFYIEFHFGCQLFTEESCFYHFLSHYFQSLLQLVTELACTADRVHVPVVYQNLYTLFN